MSDVFVSYASADREAAFRIVDYLEGQGIRCWIAPRDVSPGMEYGEAIIDAIERTRALVLVLSEQSNESTFVRKEVERAVSKTRPVLPVRIREVTPAGALEFYISSAQWVDAWKSPLEQHLLPLVAAIRAMGDPTAHGAVTATPLRSLPSPARSNQSLLVAGLVLLVTVGLGAVLWMGRDPQPTRSVPVESASALPQPGGSATPSDTGTVSPLPPATEGASAPVQSPVNGARPPPPAPARVAVAGTLPPGARLTAMGPGGTQAVSPGGTNLPAGLWTLEFQAPDHVSQRELVTLEAGASFTWNPAVVAEPALAEAANPEPAPVPAGFDEAAARAEVEAALAAFAGGFQSRDMQNVIRRYPTSSEEWRGEWRPLVEDTRNFRDLQAGIEEVRHLSVAEGSADVQFVMSLRYVDLRNRPQSQNLRFRGRLVPGGNDPGGNAWMLIDLQTGG